MTQSASNLLIAAAIDFAGHGWPDGTAERMAGSLGTGKGGRVTSQRADSAILLSRARAGGAHQARSSASEHGAFVLFAGHLFDRPDLRQRLGLPLNQPLDDGALYSAAHARWGDDCDRHVIGHYAAILWLPEQGLLRAARSSLDPSPLHWWQDGTRLVVASTPRAIFAAGAPRALDDAKLDAALVGSFADQSHSWFSGIKRVEGGTVMTWQRGKTTCRQFWSIDTVPEVRFKRDDDYVGALDELFARATAQALVDVHKPCLFLSGGLDSQAVASYALEAREPQQTLDCYTSVPAPGFTPIERVDSFPDERAHVEALAAMHPRLRVNYVEAPDLDFTDRLAEMFLLCSTMPMNALNMHWIHHALAQASAAGHDAMLTGDYGNTGFSYDGDTAFPWWLRRGKLARLVRELGAVDLDRPLHRRLMTWAVMPNLPQFARAWVGQMLGKDVSVSPGCPLRKGYIRNHGLEDLGRDAPSRPARSARIARAQLLNMSTAEGGDIELGLELLHGLSFRDPTAYRPLLEFCAGIPEDQYRRDGVSRWLARRLLKGRIPDSVRLEKRRGHQAADWPMRLDRNRPALIAELETIGKDEALSQRFDVPRITAALEQWDGRDSRASSVYETVAQASSRAIVASRFIRFANGSNG